MSKISGSVGKTILLFTLSIGSHGVTGQNVPIISNQSFTIDENSGRYGEVASIIAVDPDHDQLACRLLKGNDIFDIDQKGHITVKRTGLFFVNRLDFETQPRHELIVQVTDDGSPPMSATATITLELNDINEFPVITLKEYDINRNSANGDIVGKIDFSDDDSGQTHEFVILSGNSNAIFDIDQSTGELSILNREALQAKGKATYTLTIAVSDDGEPQLTGTGTVSIHVVDDNPPAIDSKTFAQDEK